MKKYLFLAITALAVSLGTLVAQPSRANGIQDKAQASVKSFYSWYIKLNGNLT
jgi:hypothetical protein